MSNPVCWENKENINLSSAELAQKMVMVHMIDISGAAPEWVTDDSKELPLKSAVFDLITAHAPVSLQ